MKKNILKNIICLSACSMMMLPSPLYAKTKRRTHRKYYTVIRSIKTKKSRKKRIKLNYKKLKLSVGMTKKLKLKNYKGKTKWKTSNKKIVSINKKGKIKAIKAGKAKITVKLQRKKYTCKITVVKPELNYKKLSLKVGDSKQLKLKKTIGNVTWKSSDNETATVTKNGKIKAKKAGKVTITAKNQNKNYRCKITIKDNTVGNNKQKEVQQSIDENINDANSDNTESNEIIDNSLSVLDEPKANTPWKDYWIGDIKNNNSSVQITFTQSDFDNHYVYLDLNNAGTFKNGEIIISNNRNFDESTEDKITKYRTSNVDFEITVPNHKYLCAEPILKSAIGADGSTYCYNSFSIIKEIQ